MLPREVPSQKNGNHQRLEMPAGGSIGIDLILRIRIIAANAHSARAAAKLGHARETVDDRYIVYDTGRKDSRSRFQTIDQTFKEIAGLCRSVIRSDKIDVSHQNMANVETIVARRSRFLTPHKYRCCDQHGRAYCDLRYHKRCANVRWCVVAAATWVQGNDDILSH